MCAPINKPVTIDWRITSACNNGCDFCYACADIPYLRTTEEIDRIFEKIKELNPNNICITGGEPTLHPLFDYIMQKCIANNLNIYLSTNGSNFCEKTKKYLDKISKLSLPLDGYNAESFAVNGRKRDWFNTTMLILEYLKSLENRPRCMVKITTMLTQKNVLDRDGFEEIFHLLMNYPIDCWKIYQFIPEGRGALNKEQYLVGESDCEIVRTRIESLEFRENPDFYVDYPTRSDRNSAYFIIQPDGSVMVPMDNGDSSDVVTETTIGNLLVDDLDSILQKWNDNVSIDKYTLNTDRRSILLTDLDSKIITEIDSNPFISDAELASIYNKTEEFISSRIKYIYERNVIKQIIPVINVTNFGYGIYLANLKFFNCSKKKQEIFDYLKKEQHTLWLVECLDTKDDATLSDVFYARIGVLVKYDGVYGDSKKKIESTDLTFEQLCAQYAKDLDVDLEPQENNVYKKYIREQKFLVEEKKDERISYDEIELKANSLVRLKTNEVKILEALDAVGREGRLTYEKLSAITKISPDKIKKIIKELRDNKVINKFQVVYNVNVIGYCWYEYFLKFKQSYSQDEFINTILNEENNNLSDSIFTRKITHINCLENGRYSLDLEIKVKTNQDKLKFDDFLQRRFGDYIDNGRTYDACYRIVNEYKFEFLTPLILAKMGNKGK